MVKDSTKISFFIFAILFILAIYDAKPANAVLECQVRNGGCLGDEFSLLKMSDTNNAHAGFETTSPYSNKICCKDSLGIVDVGYSCSGNTDTFLYLQDIDNSHVEENFSGAQNYSNKSCISVDQGSITCGYESGSCSGQTSCLASISGSTNAHIGDCDAYSKKVCCGITYPDATCSLNVSDTSINLGDSVTLTWSSTNAVTATSSFGETSFNGSRTVSLTATTTYTFTAVNPFSVSASCSRTVTVNTLSPPTCALSVLSPSNTPPSPQVTGNQAYRNEDSILSWTITGTATSATLTDIPGSFNPGSSGSITINISSDKTYTMTVNGPGGSGTCSLDVVAIDCSSDCPGGCGDTGQIDNGCGGTCPDNTGNSCNDNNACTYGDVCSGGVCAGPTPVTCDSPPNNQCYNLTGSCDSAIGCVYTQKPDGTLCDDGNDETMGDSCSAGVCQVGGYKSIPEFIKDATKWLLGFAVSLALIVIIIAGIAYNSSSGDENKTRIAKGLLKYALMGLLVSGISYAIVVALDKIL